MSSVSQNAPDISTAKLSEDHRLKFRNAMAHMAAAVTIVTTDGEGGLAGFAATAVCSVSDTPPTLLICVNKRSSAYTAVIANQVVCVNVLDAAHADLSRLFGGRTPVEERFAAANWKVLQTGAPSLEGALVSLDCRIKQTVDASTHQVLFCEVLEIVGPQKAQALVYFDRNYHSI